MKDNMLFNNFVVLQPNEEEFDTSKKYTLSNQ